MGLLDTGSTTNTYGLQGLQGLPQTNDLAGLFKLFQQSQMTPLQSLATAIPAYQFAQNAGKYLQPAQNTANAMVDINSPQYQQLYQQNRQQGQNNLAQQLMELSAQNRKLATLGRVPLFSPERGGEQLFRQLMLGGQQADINAANQTQDILGRSFNAQTALAPQQMAVGAGKSSTKGNVLGVIAKLFGL